MSNVLPLWQRIPTLPELPVSHRLPGSRVYAHGVRPATVVGIPDALGVTVREGDDAAPVYVEYDRLTDAPAPPLRLTISREDMQVGPEWSPWGVFGNRPDEDGDYLWAHFETHAEAVDYAAAMLRKESER